MQANRKLAIKLVFVVLLMFFCVLRIKEWVDQMQKELITLTDTASGMDNLIQVSMTFCFCFSFQPISDKKSKVPDH